MRKLIVHTEIGFVGCEHVDEIELGDDDTEADIDHMAEDAAMEHLEYWHEIVDCDEEQRREGCE